MRPFLLSLLLVTVGCVNGTTADWVTDNFVENVGNGMRCAYNKKSVCVCVWISLHDRHISGIAIDNSGASCR